MGEKAEFGGKIGKNVLILQNYTGRAFQRNAKKNYPSKVEQCSGFKK